MSTIVSPATAQASAEATDTNSRFQEVGGPCNCDGLIEDEEEEDRPFDEAPAPAAAAALAAAMEVAVASTGSTLKRCEECKAASRQRRHTSAMLSSRDGAGSKKVATSTCEAIGLGMREENQEYKR